MNAGESLKLECSAIIDPLLVESAEFSWIKVRSCLPVLLFKIINMILAGKLL